MHRQTWWASTVLAVGLCACGTNNITNETPTPAPTSPSAGGTIDKLPAPTTSSDAAGTPAPTSPAPATTTSTPSPTATSSEAVVIGVRASTGSPGSPVDVQVFLDHSDGLFTGMQIDIAWDVGCLSVISGNDEMAACSANPALAPKEVLSRIHDPSILRAVFLSLSDVQPIGENTWLFACQFSVAPAPTTTQCPITLSNVIVSGPQGQRLPVTTVDGVVPIGQSPP
jgi:hypothetical protein